MSTITGPWLTITSCSEWLSNPKSKALLSCVCWSERVHEARKRGPAWTEGASHTLAQQHRAARMGFVIGEGNKPCQKAGVMSSTGCHRTVRTTTDVTREWMIWNVWEFYSGKLPGWACVHNICKRQVRQTDPFWCGHGPAAAVAHCFSQWCILFLQGPISSPACLCPAKMHSLMYIVINMSPRPQLPQLAFLLFLLTLYTPPSGAGAL